MRFRGSGLSGEVKAQGFHDHDSRGSAEKLLSLILPKTPKVARKRATERKIFRKWGAEYKKTDSKGAVGKFTGENKNGENSCT